MPTVKHIEHPSAYNTIDVLGSLLDSLQLCFAG